MSADVELALGDASWPAVVQAIGSVAAVVVTVVGFIFLWAQVQGIKRTIQSEASYKMYSKDFEILTIFVDKPHLRPYFYDDVKIAIDDLDVGAVATIAELYCSHFEQLCFSLTTSPVEYDKAGLAITATCTALARRYEISISNSGKRACSLPTWIA